MKKSITRLSYRIKSRLLRKTHQFDNGKKSLSASFQMIPSPAWVLFERMRWAEENACRKARIDYAGLHALQQARALRSIDIDVACFNVETVVDAIKQLAAAGGGEVRLPAGTLELTMALCIPEGVILIGCEDRTTLIFKHVDYGIRIAGTAEQPVQQAGLKSLRIFHQGGHKFCAAILATHTRGLLLENIRVVAPRAVGVLLADNVQQTILRHCSVEHAGLVGFMLIRDVSETVMQGCVAEYCHQSGVFLTDLKLPKGVDPLDFQAQLDYTDHVIGNFAPFAPQDPAPLRTEMTHCIFRRNRKMGITTDGVGYLSVKNSIIAHNDCEGITIDNGSWGCQIQNCHVFNNGWRGVQHDIELGIDFVKEMGLMADGSSKAKLPGISLDNAALTRIENNHIECNWGDGIKLVRAGYASTIAHNLIENNNRGINDRFHFFGILVGVAERQHPEQYDFPSANNQIIYNDILGGHFAGIHLMLGVSGNVIQQNRIEGATFEAVEDHVKSGNWIELLNS